MIDDEIREILRDLIKEIGATSARILGEDTPPRTGVPARTLSATLAKRFDVRADDETRLMRHRHQGIPELGYAELMRRIRAALANGTFDDLRRDLVARFDGEKAQMEQKPA